MQALALIATFPAALASGFGRFRSIYLFGAHACAQLPGPPGIYLRAAYYAMTLRRCSQDVAIHHGAFFAHPEAEVSRNVSVGPYSVIGRATIGEDTQIAGQVQIVSGTQQHQRDGDGNLTNVGRVFREVKIGSHCWIGAGAIITTDVGDKATVGAGAVVVKPVPEGTTVVGNPARVLE